MMHVSRSVSPHLTLVCICERYTHWRRGVCRRCVCVLCALIHANADGA